MKRNLLCFAAILLSVTAADAQGWFPKPTPNDTLRSTVILPDNGVVFQIYATEAESVAVTGDLPWDNPVRFAKDMVTSIIPYIEDNYRVYTDQANRAMAGLSMGGMETLEVTLNNPEMFSHVWVLSASFAPGNKEVYEYERVRLKKEASRYNKNFKQLVFTQGGPTDIAYNNCKETLKLFDDAKINYEYHEVPGGHSCTAWRQNLYDLAQRLFR